MEIRKLNALRGLAALIVFFTHFSDITLWLDGALSGFLMAYPYLSKEFIWIGCHLF